jgi:hypothetical protein
MSQYMSETIEAEIDDVHLFMIDEMTDEDVDYGEFAEQLLEQTIYNAYQGQKSADTPADSEGE